MRDARRQLEVIDRQLDSLARDRTRLQARIVAAQTEWFDIRDEPLGDPSRRRGVSLDDAARLSQLSVLMTGLTRQAVLVDEQIRGLQTKAAQLGRKHNQERQVIAAHSAAVREIRRRVQARENQWRRLEAKRPTRRVTTDQMQKFSTYLPFPFEEEKQRVLGWFAGRPGK